MDVVVPSVARDTKKSEESALLMSENGVYLSISFSLTDREEVEVLSKMNYVREKISLSWLAVFDNDDVETGAN